MSNQTTTTAAAAKPGKAAEPAPIPRTVQDIPLGEVYFDPNWNARTPSFTSGTGDAGEDRGTADGIVSLMQSMKAGRQDTPVLVRPMPATHKGAPKGAKYLGVYGFRRHAAISLLAHGGDVPDGKGGTEHINPGTMAKNPAWDPKNPTITASVDASLDEIDALAANIAENTARDDLRAPDLAFQIHNYLKAVPPEDTKRRAVSHMAKKFGKVERYVRRLVNISQALLVGKFDDAGKQLSGPEPKVFAHWRAEPVHVPVKEMDLLVKNPGPYQAQYDNLAKGDRQLTSGGSPQEAGEGGEGGTETTTWIDGAIAKAEGIGKVLGIVEAHCDIRADEQEDEDLRLDLSMVQWDDALIKALAEVGGPKVKKSATGVEKNRIIAAAKRGVREGHTEALAAHAKALKAAAAEAEEEAAEDVVADAAPKKGKAN